MAFARFLIKCDANLPLLLLCLPQIVLNSMHKYQPRIHLIMRRDPNTANLPITDLDSENYRTFVFPETVFTAVTGRLSSFSAFQLVYSRWKAKLFLVKIQTHRPTNGTFLSSLFLPFSIPKPIGEYSFHCTTGADLFVVCVTNKAE